MENFIIIALLVVIIGLAASYVYKQKKKGNKCIGCPNRHLCKSKNNSDFNCH